MKKRHNADEEKAFHIIIVGCGKVGSTLVSRLSEEGHYITVIDKDKAVINSICESNDVLGIIGNGASYNVQMEAGIEHADLMIAVTDSDELNLLCCTIAKKVVNCSAIARVRNPDYAEELSYLREKLGISMIINPELETANEIARILRFPTAIAINSFAKGKVEMIKFKVPEENTIAGKPLSQLQKYRVLICAVERAGELVIPNGDFVLQAGDVVSYVATVCDAHVFFKAIGLKTHRVSDSMIIGGGKTSYYLAKQLLESGIEVKLIELDQKRCEDLSILLDKAVIICGDGADAKFLESEGLAETESFVPLTGIDEENILLTLHARRNPNTKVITKVNRITFDSVIESLDLGSVVYPRYITAESIVAYVRAKQNAVGSNVETLYHIFDDRAEAVEFRIEADSPVLGVPLKELRLKKNLLVCCISRHGKTIIPNGSDEICIGDTVIVVSMHTGLHDVSDILEYHA